MSWRTPENLSADGIRTAGGAIAADLEYLLTAGSANAYTATPSPAWASYADGAVLYLEIHAASTTAANINVSGLGTVEIYKVSQSGSLVALTGTELPVGLRGKFVYDSGISKFVLASDHRLQAADIPSTLNTTTLPRIDLSGGGLLLNTANSSYNYLCGGSTAAQSSGSFVGLFGNSHATKPGDAEYYCGSASGAAHSFFDKNGVEQLLVSEAGIAFGNLSAQGDIIYRVNNLGSTKIYGGTDATSARLELWGASGTYPGAHQQFAPLTTLAASTAIALCPVATGDTAEVDIHETTIAGCKAFVDAAGTVTLYSPIYGTVSASIVNSSSPAAGEYGVYISAGVLYFKGGSSYAGKMAHKDFVGKA